MVFKLIVFIVRSNLFIRVFADEFQIGNLLALWRTILSIFYQVNRKPGFEVYTMFNSSKKSVFFDSILKINYIRLIGEHSRIGFFL